MNYKTKGVCSTNIYYEIDDDGLVRNVEFTNGCQGNGRVVGKLVDGLTPRQVIERLEGVQCHSRGTSCPDQLALAMKEYEISLIVT